ncbi:helix-turn-helix transcriptional regulator [Candidatus Pacearchaeota archaeon]|nr:helix-turn-helix transcriptional regulator [Candidatus Pacearchaeota archaeon]
MDNTGTKIAAERKKNKLSRSGLARRIGISDVHLWRIEKSLSQPGALVLAKIAKVLGKPMDYFMPKIIVRNTKLNVEKYLVYSAQPSYTPRVAQVINRRLKMKKPAASASLKSKKQKGAEVHKIIGEIKAGTEELLQQVTTAIKPAEDLKKKVGNFTLVLNGSDNIFSVYAELEEITRNIREAEAKLKACLEKLGDS